MLSKGRGGNVTDSLREQLQEMEVQGNTQPQLLPEFCVWGLGTIKGGKH